LRSNRPENWAIRKAFESTGPRGGAGGNRAPLPCYARRFEQPLLRNYMLSNLLAALCAALPHGAPAAAPSLPSAVGSTVPSIDSSLASLVDVKAVYAEQCAKCHGENGDGKGTAELARPARSFLDGGYSYGNTQKAVLRSITYGIPGTPMPAFGESLSVDDRKALADFVIGLGPKGTIVKPGASVLTVGDKPQIVHGMMPALQEGTPREPRSLVVGFPNGTTFQYTKASGTLEGLFVGDFLDRADWGGRGGSALRPLGTVTWQRSKGHQTSSALVDGSGKPFTSKIRAARIVGDGVRLDFSLFSADGKRVGGGQEFLSFLNVGGVPVPQRSIVGTGRPGAPAAFAPLDGEPVASIDAVTGPESSNILLPKTTVKVAGKDLFAVEFEGISGVRVLVHTSAWSDDLTAAIRSSLNQEGN